MGPMLMDLAALTAGRWTEDERAELAIGYRAVAGEEGGTARCRTTTSCGHSTAAACSSPCSASGGRDSGRLRQHIRRTGSARRFTPPTGSGSETGARVNGMTRSTRTALLLLLVLGCTVPRVVAQTAVEVRGVVTDETGGTHRGSGGHADGRARGEDHGHDQSRRPLPGGRREPWQDDVDGRGGGLRALDPHGHGDRRGQYDDRRQAAGRDRRTCRCSRRAGRRVARFGPEPLRDQAVGQSAGGASGRSGVSAAGASAARGHDRHAPGPRDVLRRWPAADAAAAAQGRHPERADQCESVFRRVRRAGSEPRRDPDQARVRALSRQRTDRFQRLRG